MGVFPCQCREDPQQQRFNEWELRELEDREDWEEDVPTVSLLWLCHCSLLALLVAAEDCEEDVPTVSLLCVSFGAASVFMVITVVAAEELEG